MTSLLTEPTPAAAAALRPVHVVFHGDVAALRAELARAAAGGHTHAVTTTPGSSPADAVALLAAARARPTALVLGTRADARTPWAARIARWVTARLIWLECGVSVRDAGCGARAYPLPSSAALGCSRDAATFPTEVITRAAWAGVAVVAVPLASGHADRPVTVRHLLRMVAVHGRLVTVACNPLPFGRRPARRSPSGVAPARGQSIPRRFVRWLNPMTAWRQARRDDAGRARFAAGVAAGVFIGALPVWGGQTLLSLFVARRFRLHPLAVMAGSNLAGPPIGLALVAAEVAVGHLLLHGSWPTAGSFDLSAGQVGHVLRPLLCEWLTGAALVATALAALTFVAIDLLLRALPDVASPDADE